MPVEIHLIHHTPDSHTNPGNEVPAWARELLTKVGLIHSKLEKIMATLDEVLADVAAESTAIDSLSVFVAGLKQQLADALAGVLTPEVQAKVDAIFAGVEANKAKVVAALEPTPTP